MEETTRVSSEPADALREGLVILCRQLACPTSAAELGDGLALEHGCLPLEMVPRALRRAGVSARVIEADVEALGEELLPALLRFEDGRYLVLVECQGDEAVLLAPESGGGQVRMALERLKRCHTGTTVVAHPDYQPDQRAGDFAREQEEHWFRGPLKRRWKTFAEVGVAAMMANLLAISTALFAMQVYDRVVPNEAFETLWILASGVALAVVLEFVLRCLRGHLLDVTGKGLDLQLSSLLFERVMQMRLSAKPSSTGAFSNQIREFESVREFFTSSTIGAISDMPFVLLFLGVIFFIGGPVVWVPIAAVVLMVLPGLLAQGRLAKLSRQNLREGAVRQGVLLESVEHLETVKTTRAEGRNLRLWENLSGDLSEASVKLRSLSVMLGYGATMVQQLCYVGVVVVGVYQISAGNMTIGALIACTILTSRTVAPMTQVAGILARWQHVKVAMEGLDELMDAPVERPADRDFARKPKLYGHYRLEDVVLRYQEDAPAALNLKELEIDAGEHLALLGGNGAGKSTLLRLMAGLTDPGAGRIMLDDIGLGQIEPVDRRRAIGYLPQDIALFYGTLRDNLTLDGAAYDDEELLEVLDAVGLGTFVRRHTLGLDLPIQSSTSVSGGQRQAIGLARLLLQDPRIVLMDEPTAAFDQTNEQHVIRYLQEWLKGRTLVVSTHKRALLNLVERAVVLRDGAIVMDGPRDSVVSGNQVKAPPRPQKVSGERQD
ncbi:type I secretion system permease/ATPase [Halomonas halmophila]|uniref:ABC transporter ATP-binding protein/permease n=1 Tax=Halomonas halmophila TaxID=252 RepID=A0A4Y4F7P0_9GAMM|nr:type I secretion system permease/ATPase [Halomonas halmophila]GED23640.1 ABC transporter ATP-binding protein/permease [Halomonas halmophila]